MDGERLSLADRLYVRLLTGSYASTVVTALESRPERWVEITGGRLETSLRANLGEWLRLVRETMPKLSTRRSAPGPADVVHAELSADPENQRREYYGLFLPDTVVDYVSSDTEVCKTLPAASTLFKLLGLLCLIPFGNGAPTSQLSGRRVSIARYCLAVLSHALRSTKREAYLMRLYQPHIPVLAGFLMEQGIRVNLVTNPGRMLAAEYAIPADKLVLTNPLQVDVALGWDGERAVRSLDLWGPFDLPDIRRAQSAAANLGHEQVELGVYTQGYWLRLREGYIAAAVGRELVDLERELMEAVGAYLLTHPETRVIRFPHPMERRHHAKTGETGPWELLSERRVESRFDESSSSIETFGLARIGVTTLSTVAYDRLYAGYPAFFYSGTLRLEAFDWEPSVDKLVLRSPDELLEAVELALQAGDAAFFEKHFGGRLDQWQPTAEQRAAMESFGNRAGA